jgi:integrase
LTDATVRALRPADVRCDVPDGRVPGLYLSVLPSGRKQWTLRYRTQGKQRRLVLGEYGDAPKLTLSKAREAAEKQRPQIREGGDPVQTRALAKAKRADTVEALAADYLAKHARKRKRTAAEDDRILTRDVLPHWRDRSVQAITRRDVRDVLARIVDRGAPIAANRTLEIIRKMFNFGISHDWLEHNPAARIEKPGVEHTRDRVLTDDEIRRLWAVLDRVPNTAQKQAPGRRRAKADAHGRPFCPISPALAAVTKLRLVTAQRGGEVVRMRWADVDLPGRWWTIPAEHAKNGLAHRVPLTSRAIAIIEARQPDADQRVGYVFADTRTRPPVKPATKADADAGVPVQRMKKAGAALARALTADLRATGVPDAPAVNIRSHDLRRTAATRMASAGVSRLVIGKVLNHVEPGVTAIYDRHGYDREKVDALATWARELDRILDAATTGHVIPMRRA